jgi:hypothetical protein
MRGENGGFFTRIKKNQESESRKIWLAGSPEIQLEK